MIGIRERQERGREKKIFAEIMANNFPNFFENYKPTDLRSSIPYKHQNQEKKYTNIHHNQIAQNQ